MTDNILSDINIAEVNCDEDIKFEATLKQWRDTLTMLYCVYEQAYELFDRISKSFGIIIFILSSVTSILNVYTDISAPETITSLICTIITGIGQILSFQNRTQDYISYLADVQNFLGILISREILSCELRDPARDVIIGNKDIFVRLVSTAPAIPNYLYSRYHDNYVKRKNLSQKTDQIIKIV